MKDVPCILLGVGMKRPASRPEYPRPGVSVVRRSPALVRQRISGRGRRTDGHGSVPDHVLRRTGGIGTVPEVNSPGGIDDSRRRIKVGTFPEVLGTDPEVNPRPGIKVGTRPDLNRIGPEHGGKRPEEHGIGPDLNRASPAGDGTCPAPVPGAGRGWRTLSAAVGRNCPRARKPKQKSQ